MSAENVDIARRVNEAWNADDLEAALALMHPEAEVRGPSDLFMGIEGAQRGRAEIEVWWRALKEPWESFSSRIERTFDEGDRAVVAVRMAAVGRESGVRTEASMANVYEIRDGLVFGLRIYESLETAREAEGLSG